MSLETAGRKQSAPQQLRQTLSQQGLEEEEVGLASDQTAPASHNYTNAIAGAQGSQRRYKIMMHIATVIFIAMLLFFCYRKFYKPANRINIPPQIRQNIASLPEEELEPIKAEAPPVELLQLQPNIWYYADNSEDYHQLRVLYQANNRKYAMDSNFTFVSLNKLIFRQYLSGPARQIIFTVGSALSKHKRQTSILRMFTLLFILYQHGGIAISDNLLLTEDLTWLKDIRTNPFLNGNFAAQKVEVVGFYAPEQSPDPVPVDWSTNRYRQTIAYPALQSYFLAAKKDSDFMDKLIKHLSQTLTSSEALAMCEKKLAQHPTISLQDYLFQNSVTAIMMQKGVNAAILYGLAVINEHYGPTKMEIQMRDVTFDQRMILLSHLELSELEDNFGKFRYLTLLKHEDELSWHLSNIKTSNKALMDGSFMRTYLLTDPKLQFAYPNIEKEAASQELWKDLPKIVWVYSPKGIESSGIVTTFLVARIQAAAKEIQFEFREVNDSNIHLYLDNRTIQRLDIAQTRLDAHVNQNTKSELVRLALIFQHGGVFLDLSIVLVQSLDWLIEVASISSGRIFDRCGHLPKVFLLWDPLSTHPLSWKVNEECNTKSAPHLAYLDHFIAAEPKSPLIKEWLDMHLSLLSTPSDEIQETFQQCGIDGYQISDSRSMQKLGLDALQCVLGNREKEMELQIDREETSASSSYQLWSMSSLLGLYKATPANLLQKEAIYELTQYPANYLEQARGHVHYFLKLSDEQTEELTDFFIQHHEKLMDNLHPESIVAKYVLGTTQFKLVYENGAMRVKM